MFLQSLTLPTISNGELKTTIYEIPQNFGSFLTIDLKAPEDDSIEEYEATILTGLIDNCFISLQLLLGENNTTTSVLLHYSGTLLDIISNSNKIEYLSLYVNESGDLKVKNTSREPLSGSAFLIGKQSNQQIDISASNIISLNQIVQNGIAAGSTPPNVNTPGQIYIQTN